MQRMQTRRRKFAVVLTALTLCASTLAGCGDEESKAPLPDAATLLKQSSETTRTQKSTHLEIKVDGSIPELPVHTLSGDLTNSPDVAAKGNANINVLGQAVDAEFVVKDKILYAALTKDKWTDFGPAADIYDPSVILDPDKGLAHLVASVTDPKADGREKINGVQTVRIKGMVPAEAISNIVPEVNEPVPGTQWIREDGNHDLMKSWAEISKGNTIELTLSDWGKPVTVDKPNV